MSKDIKDKIKHVVVLMLENRSFDHIFGDFPGVNGINNASRNYHNLMNPYSPNNPASNLAYYPYPIDVGGQIHRDFNPGHSFAAMMQDLFGRNTISYTSATGPSPTPPPCYPTQTNCGFLHPMTESFDAIMSYFRYIPAGGSGRLNVLHTLAEQFRVCDNWFCDVPANTIPNRMFMHAATCQGWLSFSTPGPDGGQVIDPGFYFGVKSIYEQLTEHGRDWAMCYYAPYDGRDSLMFSRIARESRAQLPIERFQLSAQQPDLGRYALRHHLR